ncbi:MAG: archease [Deltaproteobacteria bacterium]|nr:MAG: archease [Deltaproteobacteria bacterium]
MEAPRWEHFDHGADIGVRGIGRTLSEAFEQVGLALTAVVTAPSAVRPEQCVEIECRAQGADMLLVEWLDALVYRMATGRMLFSRFDVEIDGDCLRANVFGEPVDRDRHRPAVEVKGPTLTALSVERTSAGLWKAQCVVDV